jgi:hypothetical protein
VPVYESRSALQSSPIPKAASQPSEGRVTFANSSNPSRTETAHDSDSDSFDLEAHHRFLDDVKQFIAAHDFDDRE